MLSPSATNSALHLLDKTVVSSFGCASGRKAFSNG
jgi:hypothetical protein